MLTIRVELLNQIDDLYFEKEEIPGTDLYKKCQTLQKFRAYTSTLLEELVNLSNFKGLAYVMDTEYKFNLSCEDQLKRVTISIGVWDITQEQHELIRTKFKVCGWDQTEEWREHR